LAQRFLKLRTAQDPRKSAKQPAKATMRWFLSFLLLGLLSIVSAVSTSGSRLLVVLDEVGEKKKYGKYFGDLEGRWIGPL